LIRVTRRYTFAASHRLHAAGLSDSENRRVFGKCDNPYGHGHNYVLEVSVRGPVDARTGLAAGLPALDGVVHQHAIRPFDHRNLNADVEAFREVVPTTENLALEILRRLRAAWPQAFPAGWPRLEKIRIAETDRNIFEVYENSEYA
jgi:6-pyruvoyltetrahydropterin/6-carboxytetrahydropterin synthase